jgi:hypothetical protein
VLFRADSSWGLGAATLRLTRSCRSPHSTGYKEVRSGATQDTRTLPGVLLNTLDDLTEPGQQQTNKQRGASKHSLLLEQTIIINQSTRKPMG